MKYFMALTLALGACGEAHDWQGWIYPRADNLAFGQIPIGAFSNQEACRNAAKTLIANFHLEEDGESVPSDYECGLKCKADGGLGGLNVCEKTER